MTVTYDGETLYWVTRNGIYNGKKLDTNQQGNAPPPPNMLTAHITRLHTQAICHV